ncbi:glycosyltransferase family 2 protein [Marinobacter sp. UBA2688]|uniref:glycosyltransferase family 2 protein n=1 Tax=Marinobacter sp. UBA2688 TaxID=1946816 RepID=UPI00257A7C71|nr:glycosyltransferase family 2 protein [Marinobacter sp. UBA2688]|tara:strand:- start:4123 stop:5058 length:936 start_codon:yes stop_codon:yes gene_type:complete
MIDIVTVNWNAGLQLKECINSALSHNKGELSRIIVVDNGSTDDSVAAVEGLSCVEVIHTGENLGFAAACNIGAQAGSAPYILFLNPDTRLEEGALSVPLAFMEQPENAKVGICGIQLIDEHDKVSRTCARFPTLRRLVSSALGMDKVPGLYGSGMRMCNWDHKDTRKVDQVMGAFFFVRREAFEACGGFDERFFVYFEEVDVANRSKSAGFDSWYLAEARAFHAGGGTSRQVKAHRLFYSLRGRILYAFKHFPRWQAWTLVAVTNLLEPFTRSIWCLLRGDFVGIKHTWAAYRMLWRSMGHILQGEGRYNP